MSNFHQPCSEGCSLTTEPWLIDFSLPSRSTVFRPPSGTIIHKVVEGLRKTPLNFSTSSLHVEVGRSEPEDSGSWTGVSNTSCGLTVRHFRSSSRFKVQCGTNGLVRSSFPVEELSRDEMERRILKVRGLCVDQSWYHGEVLGAVL